MGEPNNVSRRTFIKGLAAAAAGLSLGGCSAVKELIEGPAPTPTLIPTAPPTTVPTATPTPEPTAVPAMAPVTAPAMDNLYTGAMELPVTGATGYTAYSQSLFEQPDSNSVPLYEAAAGTAFLVLEITGREDWFRVAIDGWEGWLPTAGCMINLPDVVPSMLYDDTDAYASAFVAQGREIPGITGQQLYNATAYSARFDREQFIMPVLYHAAKKFHAAQQAALAAGYCLRVYELFRPMETQRFICDQVCALAAEDEEVNAGISTPPWNTDWFIATGRSNHQMGYAGDVSLVRVRASAAATCGGYSYTVVTDFEPVEMPTVIHEMSNTAASLAYPVSPTTDDWRVTPGAESMNYGGYLLRKFCTGAGLTPLASEWWHFNDNEAITQDILNHAMGEFVPSTCLSVVPT